MGSAPDRGYQLSRSIALLSTILMAASAPAHHSPARFHQDQVIAIQGTVTRYDWTNPHVYLVVRDSGQNEWLLEANATSILRRIGWNRDSFVPGDTITFRANPNRDPEKTHVSLISITRSDGADFTARLGNRQLGGDNQEASTSDLAGVWRGDPSLAFKFLFGFIDHPLTDKGEAAMASYDESMDPAADCVPWPSPRILAWNAFYLIEIELGENVIRFMSEFDNVERIIHMDGRAHPKDGARTNQGHSIGWWEADTLVVDTRLFADSRSPVANGIRSGAEKHVVERYTLSDNGTKVLVDILLEDREFLAKPYEARLVWHYSPHLEMLSFECDPEVARRFVQ